MTRTVFVVQWAFADCGRSSHISGWNDYKNLEFLESEMDLLTEYLAKSRRRESIRPHPVQLRAVKRIIADEWLVGL